MDRDRNLLVDFNDGKTQLVSFDWPKKTSAIDMKMDGSVLDENHLLRCWALIPSTKFPSPEVALYLYKSTIGSCMEYCCHVWAGALSCYL